MHWLIQQINFENDFNGPLRMMYAAQELHQPVTVFRYFPFEGTDYSFFEDIEGPVVLFGTLNSLQDIRKRVEPKPHPLAWDRNMNCSDYYEPLREFILQKEHQFIQLNDILVDSKRLFSLFEKSTDRLFVRPNDNKKTFNGQIIHEVHIENWADSLIREDDLAAEDSIVIAPVKSLEYEWRFFMVAGRAVAGSQYKTHNSIDVTNTYQAAAARFAEKVANHWSPEPIFVMDVGLHENNYYVVEIGPFNYAGLYKANTKEIVRAISNYVDKPPKQTTITTSQRELNQFGPQVDPTQAWPGWGG